MRLGFGTSGAFDERAREGLSEGPDWGGRVRGVSG